MNFHTPVMQTTVKLADFVVRNNELVSPQKLYTKAQYPNLPYDMVKIASADGRNIFLPAHKVGNITIM